MGFDPLSLILGGLQIVSAAGARNEQRRAADAQSRAQAQQTALEIEEFNRQQEEANRIARADKAERTREADKQFASMIASLADLGGLGTINATRFGVEIGFNEGVDLATIESNRQSTFESLEASKRSSRARADSAVTIAGLNKDAADQAFFGTGLQIAARTNSDRLTQERAKDKV